MSIQEFVHNLHITMRQSAAENNPNVSRPEWMARHYNCTLERDWHALEVHYSIGIERMEVPTPEAVLDALAVIAVYVDQSAVMADIHHVDAFLVWKAGLDELPKLEGVDYHIDHDAYDQCVRETYRLQQFLGTANYFQLLYRTKRIV